MLRPRTLFWALGHGQEACMDFWKEIHKILKAQSEFYLNKGLLDEINRVVHRIHVEELGCCDIDHWMSMPTTAFFPSTTLPNNNPPIFIGLKESWHFVVLKMKDENLFCGSIGGELGTDCYPRGNAVEK
ncbi:hypothetical protein VP01_6976g1 [Puccinia sorghi]|uniref:Uncharacterized protein n=1 Tax=Puccinia sorghi TaxID=27349 RepID=A0A0L6UDZ9_9BASI|nr:hypothetical protein VP01_6976g1 [Puccinia sorghi]